MIAITISWETLITLILNSLKRFEHPKFIIHKLNNIQMIRLQINIIIPKLILMTKQMEISQYI